jgi:N-acetylglucosaminyldiphosphoundecaprenol N-acetyl-beta-D-mannosaminyltransferase
MGLEFDPLTEEEAVDTVVSSAKRDEGGWVVTPNLEYLREYSRADDIKEALDDADLVVPDGTPILWASRVQGEPLPGRVAGSDLIWSIPREAARRGASVFLLGGAPGTADSASERLAQAFPRLEVAGTLCPEPGFEDDPAQLQAIAHTIARANPDIVFIGLPLRKHLAIGRRLRELVPQAWILGVGVSFSFVTGDVSRAPRWLQRLGLEWIHRLGQEPRRLFRRYLVEGIPFAGRLMAHALVARLRSRRPVTETTDPRSTS